MDILELRYFYQVAKFEHIGKASNILHVSQPSVTKTIHRLEKELGVKLFERRGRNIVLNEYGKYLKNKVEPILNTIDLIPQELSEMSRQNKNVIKLSVLAASSILFDAIVKYEKENSDIKFKLIQSHESEEADISIFTEQSYIMRDENTYVMSEEIYLAVPKKKDIKIQSDMLSDYKNEDFISLAGSKQLRSICDGFCHMAGFTPKIIFESDSPEAVRNMISANLGIGFWPQYSWGKNSDDSIKMIPIKSPECRRDIIIKCSSNSSGSNYEAVRNFFDYIKKYFKNVKEKTKNNFYVNKV